MKGKNAKTDRPPNTNPKSKLDYTQISNKNSVTHLLSQDNTNGEELHYKTVSNSTHTIDKNQKENFNTKKDLCYVERISNPGKSFIENKFNSHNVYSSPSSGIKLNYDHMTNSFFIPKSYYTSNPNFRITEGKIPRSFKLEEMNTNPNSNSSGSGSYSSAYNSKNSSSNKLLTVTNEESQLQTKFPNSTNDPQGIKTFVDLQEGSNNIPYLRQQENKFGNLELLQAKSSPVFDKLAFGSYNRFHMSPHENFSRYSQSMNEHPHVIQAKNDLRYTRKYSNATDSSSTSKFRPPSGRFNSDTSYVKNPFMNKKTYPFDSEDEKSLNINDNNDFHNKSKIKKTKHLKYGYDNYEILDLEIKLPKETKHLKILRYDDLFEAVVTFVKENELKIEMIKPILHNILKSLNGIYCILNSTLNDVDYLASLGRLWEKVKEKADEEYVQKNQRLPCSRSCDKMYREIESSSEKSEEEELF